MKNHVVIVSLAALIAGCSEEPAEQSSTSPETAALQVESAKGPARSESAENAAVYFVSPVDGDTLSNPVTIEFGISGMDVVRAGVEQPNSGHHHLLIDTELPDLSLPIPADQNHIHFGDGSTSTEITLPPGQHTLQMLLGDHLHFPHNPPLSSATITITVE
jgi:hypothetical protein